MGIYKEFLNDHKNLELATTGSVKVLQEDTNRCPRNYGCQGLEKG